MCVDWSLLKKINPGWLKDGQVIKLKSLTNKTYHLPKYQLVFKDLKQDFSFFIDRAMEPQILPRLAHFPKVFFVSEKYQVLEYLKECRNIDIQDFQQQGFLEGIFAFVEELNAIQVRQPKQSFV